ncbi:hypothetical protein SAY87_000317 [Trapa incisa]|uniref:Uncharacterized protein n=1 Tax=Trapa incisa TaxID=236973 RepID=A0AAN7GBW1_9MYRT|nr:hypothetical protein SAY87_000317 [Trapa incisa]
MESQLRSFAEIYSSLVWNSLICHAGNYTLSHASGLCCFICWFRCLHVQDLLSAQQAQGRVFCLNLHQKSIIFTMGMLEIMQLSNAVTVSQIRLKRAEPDSAEEEVIKLETKIMESERTHQMSCNLPFGNTSRASMLVSNSSTRDRTVVGWSVVWLAKNMGPSTESETCPWALAYRRRRRWVLSGIPPGNNINGIAELKLLA